MCTLATIASVVTPTNMVMAMMPIAAMVAAAFVDLGLRKAGTPLEIASTPVSAVQPLEKARRTSITRASPARFASPGSGVDAVRGALGDRRVTEQIAEQARADHDQYAADEQIRRGRERLAGLAYAAQVHRGQEGDEDERQRHAVVDQCGHRRDDVVHAGGDRDRHRHHVVDQQRGGDHQTGRRPQVRRGHLVRAAAARIGVHHLAVREHHHRHQRHDRAPRSTA